MTNEVRLAALFPGQGSQAVGMGEEFFKNSEIAQELARVADKVLGFSISTLCLQGPIEELTLTENAQPALVLLGYLCFAAADMKPIVTLGHSLGEYTALVAAGVISFEDAIQIVHKRGRYMQEAVPTGQGTMAAVMGPSEAELREIAAEVTAGVVEIANLNSPGQTVVAGDLAGVEQFSKRASEKGAKVIPLKVSAPFHCRLMSPAKERLSKDLDLISFNEPKIAVYSNVTAQRISTGAEARELLKQQVCASVRWTDEVQNVVQDLKVSHAVEFGPGGVLSKLLKRISPEVSRAEVFDPSSLEKARLALGV